MQTCAPTPAQSEEFAAWRAIALSRMPYMACLLFSVRVVAAPGLGTFAVDAGHRMYVDFDTVGQWGPSACGEVLLHEVGHLFGQHADLARDEDVRPHQHQVWNLACDASLNDDLAQAGCEHIAATGVTPGKFGEVDYQTAQHYYRVLTAKQQQAQQPPSRSRASGTGVEGEGPGQSGSAGQDTSEQARSDGPGNQNEGSSSGGSGDEGSPDSGEQGREGAGAFGQDNGVPFAGCGSASGGQSAPCELDVDDDLDGQAPAASVGEQARIRINTAAQIAEHAAKGRGAVPAGLVARAEKLLTPSVTPWQVLLGGMIRRGVRRQYGHVRADYSRRDRRRHHILLGNGKRVIFPGRSTPKVRVGVVRDTSGSMSEADLDAVTSEVVAISRRLHISGNDLQVLDTDAEAHTARAFTGPAGLAEVTGRGGTDMCVGIEAALNLPGGVDVVVVITDGMTPWPEAPVAVPVIACLVGPCTDHSRDHVPEWMGPPVVARLGQDQTAK